MLQQITLDYPSYEKPETVRAKVLNRLAIHRVPLTRETGAGLDWRVSHVRSGRMLAQVNTLTDAFRLAIALESEFDWQLIEEELQNSNDLPQPLKNELKEKLYELMNHLEIF